MSPLSSQDKMKPADKNEKEESPKKQNAFMKSHQPKKVYTQRNSVLTDLMSVNHLQTVHNISVSVFNLLVINAVVYYLTAPDMFWRDLKIMQWATSNLFLFLKLWLSFNLFAIVMFQGFKTWVQVRSKIYSKLTDTVFLLLYIASIVFMFTSTSYTMLHHPIHPITNFAIMAEQVRIFMKIYSFVRESTPRVLKHDPLKDGKQEHALYPSTKHFTYFLFVPALIYRDTYPQRKEIHWQFVFNMLFQFQACIFIAYCVFMRFVVDIFQSTGIRQFTFSEAALILAGAMVVGAVMMFLIFYSILHTWQNAWAEMTRFGDREFYQDWWNSTSFSQYYRKWNIVVYDWLHAYIYIDSCKMGSNRTVSLLLVFFFSALVHEYIIALSLGFFYPVLMVVYCTIGVTVVFITKQRTANFWNTFMWTMLFAGWGVIVCLYSFEWYARANCPKPKEASWEFFTPRSWEKSCHIFSYS